MTKPPIVGLSVASVASRADGTAAIAFLADGASTVANARHGQARAPHARPPSWRGRVRPGQRRSMSDPGETCPTWGHAVVVTRTRTWEETGRGRLRMGVSTPQKGSRAGAGRTLASAARREVAIPPPRRQPSPREIATGDAATRTNAQLVLPSGRPTRWRRGAGMGGEPSRDA